MGLSNSSLPHHAVLAPGDPRPVVRLRGRPRKVRLQPRADARIYTQTINSMRTAAISVDPVVRSLEDGDDTESVVAKLKIELARESASLAWEGQHAAEAGRDPLNYSARRIDALTKLAAITGTAIRLGVRNGLDKDVLSRVQEVFISTVQAVAQETVPDLAGELVASLRASITCEGNDRSQ